MAVKKAAKATIEVVSPQALRKMLNERWPNSTKMGNDPSLRISRISTGILSLDALLGGGFARNRHAELFGDFSAGKSATAWRFIASAQRQGLTCSYIDGEHTYDPKWVRNFGVNLKRLDLHVQETGEQCIDYMQTLLMAGLHDVVVLDSIASLLPSAERAASADDGTYGTYQARMMSRALRKLTTVNKKTAVIFINQTREAIGGSVFAKKTTTSGGRAMGFYAGVRLEFSKIETLKAAGKRIDVKSGVTSDSDIPAAQRILVTVTKDKTGGAVMSDQTTMVYNYRKGNFDSIEDLIYVGQKAGLVHKQGSNWWIEGYKDEMASGRPKFKKWIRSEDAVQLDLHKMIESSGILKGSSFDGED